MAGEYGVRLERRGWEAYQSARGTMSEAEAVAKAERKNASDEARRQRMTKRAGR